MKLIESSYEIIEQEPGLEGIYKAIERAGRTCYKSEDKITDTSAKKFVGRMIDSEHYTMLEHGTVYLRIPYSIVQEEINPVCNFFKKRNKYSIVKEVITKESLLFIGVELFVTTNFRVLVENEILIDSLAYICEPTEYHEKRVTVKFTCDRGVSHK